MYQGVALVPWLLCLSILSTAAWLHGDARPEPQVQTRLNKQEKGQAQLRPHARALSGGDDIHHGTNCFPGHATVRLSDNSLKTLADLSVGDQVATADASGRVVFEPVYFFGHRRRDVIEPFVRVNLTTTHSVHKSLELTPGHFVHSIPPGAPSRWSDRRWTLARSLSPGSTLWIRSGRELEPGRVSSVEVVTRRGAFDPFTLGGDILVNGVLVSCHHNWVLDPFVPEALGQHMPGVYQKLLYPLRAVFELSESLALPALREAISSLVRKSPILGFLSELFPQNRQQKAEL